MPLFTSAKIGLTIRNARKKRSAQIGFGFTRKMLADAIQEPVRTITLLETGRYYPDYYHIQKIAKTCGVTVRFLVGAHFNSLDDYFAAIHQATQNPTVNANKENCHENKLR